VDGLLRSIDLGEPTWGPGQERETDHEEDTGDKLDAPSCSKRCSLSGNERATVTDEVPKIISECLETWLAHSHDEDTPFNGQLLDDNDGSTLRVLGDLGEVDGHLRRCDADCHTVEYATNNEHSSAIAGNLNRCADEPPQASKHERVATAPFI